jgi:hypothetical protein
MQFKDIQGDIPFHVHVGYMAANVTGGASLLVPFRAKIVAAKLVPAAAITANGTNYFTMSFFNRGAAGAGTVQWATARSWASGNSSKAVPEALTLSSTSTDLDLAEGDVLNLECAPTGTGLIWPGGAVALTLRAR